MAPWVSYAAIAIIVCALGALLLSQRGRRLSPIGIVLEGWSHAWAAIGRNSLVLLVVLILTFFGAGLEIYPVSEGDMLADPDVAYLAAMIWRIAVASLLAPVFFAYHRRVMRDIAGLDYQNQRDRPDLAGRVGATLGLVFLVGLGVALIDLALSFGADLIVGAMPTSLVTPVHTLLAVVLFAAIAMLALLRPALAYGATIGDGMAHARRNALALLTTLGVLALLPTVAFWASSLIADAMLHAGSRLGVLVGIGLFNLFNAFHLLAVEAATLVFFMRADFMEQQAARRARPVDRTRRSADRWEARKERDALVEHGHRS